MGEGTENLLKPIVFIITMVSVSGILIMFLEPVMALNKSTEDAKNMRDTIRDLLMGSTYIHWLPTYEADPEDASNEWMPRTQPPDAEFKSNPSEEHPLKMWLIRNRSQLPHNCLVFQQEYGWFGMKESHIYVSYEEIIAGYDPNRNASFLEITLRYTFSIVISPINETVPLNIAVWQEQYYVDVLTTIEEIDSTSPWVLIWKILSFDLPPGEPLIALLVSTTFYISLSYIIMEMVRRWVPLL